MFSNENFLKNKFVESIFVAIGLTNLSYAVAMYQNWITELNWLEVFSVATSYSCAYLCVKESRWNYPIGAISVAALSILFYQQSLFSSMALNIYLIPTLIWGWFRWGHDNNTRPVTNLKFDKWLLAYGGFTVLAYLSSTWIAMKLGGSMTGLDAFILVGSILAQFLLDNKKIETWYVWAMVNVVAIYTYFNAELYLVAFQFIFFLANTVYGWWSWNKSKKMKETNYV